MPAAVLSRFGGALLGGAGADAHLGRMKTGGSLAAIVVAVISAVTTRECAMTVEERSRRSAPDRNRRPAFVASPRPFAGDRRGIRYLGVPAGREAGRGHAVQTVVLAALDDGDVAGPVLATAQNVAKMLGAPVRAMHVRRHDIGVPERLTGIGVPLEVLHGDVVQRLIEAGAADDVAAVVIGARERIDDHRPLGTTASGVAVAVEKPVVVVPPDVAPGAVLHRILLPLEGTVPTSMATRFLTELALDAGLDVLALHVLTPWTRPARTDQPRDEQVAWALEFVTRYDPWRDGAVELITRVGRTEDLIPAVAEEHDTDLILLGWSRVLTRGRARVVRAVLAESSVPVVLLPVPARSEPVAATPIRTSDPAARRRPSRRSGG